MHKKGQIELGDINPLAVVCGAIGLFVGFYSVRVMGGGGFSVGEAAYQVGIVWKILIPIVCGIACFFMGQKIFE